MKTKVCFSILLLFLCQSADAIKVVRGVKVFVTQDDPLAEEFNMSVDARDSKTLSSCRRYSEADRILSLGDGIVSTR